MLSVIFFMANININMYFRHQHLFRVERCWSQGKHFTPVEKGISTHGDLDLQSCTELNKKP